MIISLAHPVWRRYSKISDFEQGDMAIGCFGSTKQSCERSRLRLDCEAPLPGVPSMAAD